MPRGFKTIGDRNESRRRNYQQTQGLKRSGHPWELWEEDMVLNRDVSDRSLSLLIQRSVMSIQIRRYYLS